MMGIPSLNVEQTFVTIVILAFIQLHGCEMDEVPDDSLLRSPAEKPTELREGWPTREASSSVSSKSAEVETADPSVDVLELCETLAEFLAGLPGADLRKEDGQVSDALSETEQLACHVQAFGHFSALGGDDPADLVRNKFQSMGWKEELQFAGDGPDGTSFAFRKGQGLCRFQGTWDGGDDSEPGRDPSDEYRISATCTKTSPDRPASTKHGKP